MISFLDPGVPYLLTLVLGVCVGVNVAFGARPVQIIANLGIVFVFVVVAFAAPASWPWAAPIFILASTLTSLLAISTQLRGHPLLNGMGLWRRAGMWILHSRELRQRDHENDESR